MNTIDRDKLIAQITSAQGANDLDLKTILWVKETILSLPSNTESREVETKEEILNFINKELDLIGENNTDYVNGYKDGLKIIKKRL